jgi:hypothetical protein
MDHLADNLNIHSTVVTRAKEEFAKYRDLREAVQQFTGIVAACIVLAYQDLSEEFDLDIKAPVFKGPRLASDSSGSSGSRSIGPVPNKDDPAESTQSSTPMRSWSTAQTKEWLCVIGGAAYADLVDPIMTRIEAAVAASKEAAAVTNADTNPSAQADKKSDAQSHHIGSSEEKVGGPNGSSSLSSSSAAQLLRANSGSRSGSMDSANSGGSYGGSAKRKYPEVTSTFLGTTTIAGRKRVYEKSNGTRREEMTAGQVLGRLRLGQVFSAIKKEEDSQLQRQGSAEAKTRSTMSDELLREAEKHFSDAVRRRSQFEVRRMEYMEEAEKEARRLVIESRNKPPKTASSAPPQPTSTHATAAMGPSSTRKSSGGGGIAANGKIESTRRAEQLLGVKKPASAPSSSSSGAGASKLASVKAEAKGSSGVAMDVDAANGAGIDAGNFGDELEELLGEPAPVFVLGQEKKPDVKKPVAKPSAAGSKVAVKTETKSTPSPTAGLGVGAGGAGGNALPAVKVKIEGAGAGAVAGKGPVAPNGSKAGKSDGARKGNGKKAPKFVIG